MRFIGQQIYYSSPKTVIKDYVINNFGYDISKSIDELRALHKHDESCMDALPKALVSFFEGTSFEDVIRNAVSLGGDTDTIAAIAGAMAECMYGIDLPNIPDLITADMTEVVERFYIDIINPFIASCHK